MAFKIFEFDTLPSTNAEARSLAINGAQEYSAIWAHQQSGGKGRGGRKWHSPRGNLYVSYILRPKVFINLATQLSLVTAVALGDTLSEYLETSRIKNKWPNDLLVDGKKIAGILLETTSNKAGVTEWVIIGCGVNIANYPVLSNYKTTSLNKEIGVEIPIREFLFNFGNYLEIRYKNWLEYGIVEARNIWLERVTGLGSQILVKLPTLELRGVFEGLDPSGALVLKNNNGERQIITTGEIFLQF